MRSIDLVKSPKKILCSSVDIVASGIIREVVGKRYSSQFLLE